MNKFFNNLNGYVNSLNNSKFFAGLVMIILNIGNGVINQNLILSQKFITKLEKI